MLLIVRWLPPGSKSAAQATCILWLQSLWISLLPEHCHTQGRREDGEGKAFLKDVAKNWHASHQFTFHWWECRICKAKRNPGNYHVLFLDFSIPSWSAFFSPHFWVFPSLLNLQRPGCFSERDLLYHTPHSSCSISF